MSQVCLFIILSGLKATVNRIVKSNKNNLKNLITNSMKIVKTL